jgi:hypothetical protein
VQVARCQKGKSPSWKALWDGGVSFTRVGQASRCLRSETYRPRRSISRIFARTSFAVSLPTTAV